MKLRLLISAASIAIALCGVATPALAAVESALYTTSFAYTYSGGTLISDGEGAFQHSSGDPSSANFFVGDASTYGGQNYGLASDPNVYAKSYAKGTFTGSVTAAVVWHIQGTIGNYLDVASGIPVLLNGQALLGVSGDHSDVDANGRYTYGSASASISASGAALQTFYCGLNLNSGTPEHCGQFDVSDNFRLQATANDGIFEGYVSMVVRTTANNYDFASGYNYDPKFASAYIDPVITIDPTFFALHPDTRLAFSAGIVNGNSPQGIPPTITPGAVPEPSSWALMLGGFGVLGGAVRRRRTFATA